MIGRLLATAGALVVVGMCGSASAATVDFEYHNVTSISSDTWLVYRADPGETNHLTVTVDEQAHRVTFKDPFIVIRPDTANGDLAATQQACTFLGSSVTCDVSQAIGQLSEHVLLGDRNDTVVTKGTGHPLVYLDGGPGNDSLKAGVGDDTQMTGGPGADDFHGAGDRSAAMYDDHAQGVTVTVDDLPNDGAPGEGDNVHSDVDAVIGSPYADHITGGSQPVNLIGEAGDDTLTAGSAASGLYGEGGDDRLTGGGGNDSIDAGAGNDTVTAGQGSDRIYAGSGDDTVAARDSKTDRVHCDAGSDAVTSDADDAVSPDCESAGRPAGYVSPLSETTIPPVPPATVGPQMGGIAAGSDGNLWAINNDGNEVDQISSAGSVIGTFPIPTASSYAQDIAAGPDGNLWFTETVAGKIGRLTTAGAFTEFPARAGHIAAGPDGNLWFAGAGATAIGRITPDGVVSGFPTPDGGLTEDVARGPDGSVWFTQQYPAAIDKVDPATGAVTQYKTGLSGTPTSVAAGPAGNLWFTEQLADRVGRITPAGAISEYSWSLAPDSEPTGIAAGSDGNLYFTEAYGRGVSRLTTAGQVTGEWGTSGQANEVTAGPDGNIWLTEAGAVARLDLGG
jgi:streptogramin lyase